jgi:hypothetical protein
MSVIAFKVPADMGPLSHVVQITVALSELCDPQILNPTRFSEYNHLNVRIALHRLFVSH